MLLGVQSLSIRQKALSTGVEEPNSHMYNYFAYYHGVGGKRGRGTKLVSLDLEDNSRFPP